MKINKLIRVRGKVQGVFFRKRTQEKAIQLGITGWVQNEPDGSVITEIEGLPEDIKQMEQWLHVGSDRAQVKEVMLVEEGEEKGYRFFEIRR